jgi:hypothetical protein
MAVGMVNQQNAEKGPKGALDGELGQLQQHDL